MRLAIVAAMVLVAGSAFAASNSVVTVETTLVFEQVPGIDTQSIVVYTDDCYGYDLVLTALNQRGNAMVEGLPEQDPGLGRVILGLDHYLKSGELMPLG